MPVAGARADSGATFDAAVMSVLADLAAALDRLHVRACICVCVCGEGARGASGIAESCRTQRALYPSGSSELLISESARAASIARSATGSGDVTSLGVIGGGDAFGGGGGGSGGGGGGGGGLASSVGAGAGAGARRGGEYVDPVWAAASATHVAAAARAAVAMGTAQGVAGEPSGDAAAASAASGGALGAPPPGGDFSAEELAEYAGARTMRRGRRGRGAFARACCAARCICE